jgi:hypothetical protein
MEMSNLVAHIWPLFASMTFTYVSNVRFYLNLHQEIVEFLTEFYNYKTETYTFVIS